ncbi:MAG: metal-dependent transcriptional regulator [Atopobiaceae bacterium]|nr:metal-dependent transcriptional regulator [Atopobiaceae bacterium]MBR1830346.1 metal-dependent transcriptional regulator [Atopobiaceae bacterium]
MPRTESHGEGSLTMAGEDYLESIYRLIEEGHGNEDGSVRSVDVAEDLSVSKASVSKALTYLKENGMVEQARYGRVMLTAEGTEYARDVWRRHRALRKFLIQELGVEPDVADDEACLMEHDLSIDTMDKLYAYLDAHGIQVED